MKDKWFLLTVIASFVFIAISSWVMIMNTFLVNNYWYADTTAIDQALSSTLFSHSFFYVPYIYLNFLSIHAVPFFFVLLPLYSIFPNFMFSYTAQAVLVYSSAIPLYLLAKRFIGSGKYSFLIALSYLFYPGLPSGSPVEEVVMFIGPAIFAVYFLETRRKIPFLVSFLLMISTIEFAPFVGVFFFLYIVVREGLLGELKTLISRKISGRDFLKSLSNFFLLSSLILSVAFIFIDNRITLYFSSGTHPIFENISGTNFFSIQSLLSGLQVDRQEKMLNLFYLEGPFMFLSFVDPVFILQLPWILVSFLTSSSYYFSVGNYYDAFMAAFIPVGFVFALRRMHNSGEPLVKKSSVKRVVIAVLVLNIIVFAAVGSAQFYADTSASHVTSSDQGLVLLAQQMESSKTAWVGYDQLPVAGIYDWNDYVFSGGTHYALFNGSPPFNLDGYGFKAAYGSYMLYEKNYSSAPIFNYFNYSSSGAMSEETNFSFFAPPGKYDLAINISHLSYMEPLITAQKTSGYYPLAVGQAIAVPFRLNHSAVLEEAYTPGTTYWGGHLAYENAWQLSAVVTSSMAPGPLGTPSETTYNIQQYKFNNVQIEGNKTYYFWFYVNLGDAGGVIVPKSQANGTSYLADLGSNGTYNITRLNFTMPVVLLFKSDSPQPLPMTVVVNGGMYNDTLNPRGGMNIPVSIANSSYVSISVRTNLTTATAYGGSNIDISLHVNKSAPTIFFLDYPGALLLIVIASGLAAIFLINAINFKSQRERVNKEAAAVTLISLVAFWAFYALWYEGIVPFLNNYFLLKAIGVVMALSLLVAVITYDWQ